MFETVQQHKNVILKILLTHKLNLKWITQDLQNLKLIQIL